MAEGDAIHRLARRLNKQLKGAKVIASDVRVGAAGAGALEGLTFVEVVARGKHLLMRLEDGRQRMTLHSHLRMQGEWSIVGPEKRLPARVQEDLRVQLELDDGRKLCAIRMPVLDILETRLEDEVVGHLGPDLLDELFDEGEAQRRFLSDPSRPAVQAILDQRNVCGIGNLWAIEVLFLRGVYPWSPIAATDIPALLQLAAAQDDVVLEGQSTGNDHNGSKTTR